MSPSEEPCTRPAILIWGAQKTRLTLEVGWSVLLCSMTRTQPSNFWSVPVAKSTKKLPGLRVPKRLAAVAVVPIARVSILHEAVVPGRLKERSSVRLI